MGLDDFTGEEEDNEQLREELSKNQPPNGADSWREYEPEMPDWLSYISGGEIAVTEDIPNLEHGVDQLSGKVAIMCIDNVKSSTLRSDKYVDLEEAR